MIFYGINPMFEAIRSKTPPERLYFATGKEDNRRLTSLVRLAEQHGIPFEWRDRLDDLADGGNHQGVCARVGAMEEPLPDPPELGPRVIIFDGIMDPHNFGAALRVCEVFGFNRIIYHKGNSSGITPAVIKVSAGAIFHVHIYHANLNQAVRRLKDEGYAIYAMHARTESDIYTCEVPEKLCLVIGAEDKGVRHLIQRQADQLVHIPMRGRVDSLNVSCALSAALCELSRRSPWPEKVATTAAAEE